ncbi:MAG: sulfur carrier protein ThiS [Nocardioides sp.]
MTHPPNHASSPAPTILLNGTPHLLAAGATVADLLGARPGFAVAVNGEVVPRHQHADTLLREGDRVEVLTAVQGG